MKAVKSLAQASAIFLLAIQCLHADEQSWEYGEWSVDSLNEWVRYITHGDIVYGHQFGFVKRAGYCDSDLFWIDWSIFKKDVESLEGSEVTFQLGIGDVRLQRDIRLLSVAALTPSLSLLAFTNTHAGRETFSLLEKGEKLEINIISPEALVELLDVPTDYFSMNGFAEARHQAWTLCEEQGFLPAVTETALAKL